MSCVWTPNLISLNHLFRIKHSMCVPTPKSTFAFTAIMRRVHILWSAVGIPHPFRFGDFCLFCISSSYIAQRISPNCLFGNGVLTGVSPSSGIAPGAIAWDYLASTTIVHPIGANGVTDMFPAFNWCLSTPAPVPCFFKKRAGRAAAQLAFSVFLSVCLSCEHPVFLARTGLPNAILQIAENNRSKE